MANRDNPHGFTPAKTWYSDFPILEFPVDSSNGTAIFIGDAVDAEADGNIAPAAAGTDDSLLGVVRGIFDTNKVPGDHPNSAVASKHLPASTAGIIQVVLAMPAVFFVVQSDSGTNVAETDRFQTADHVAGAGDTTTGISRHELDASDIGTGAQIKIIDKVAEPGNAWGEAHVDLIVQFAESYWYDATAGL
jgi:hypothetical protein